MTSTNHHKHLPSSILILSPDKNSKRPSPTSWLTNSSSRSFSFSKIPPPDPDFFSKTSMIQLGYGVWINMTTLITGLAIGFTAIALPKMQNEDSSIKITLGQEAWIASFLTLCVPMGSLLGGILMDKYGRQPVIVLCGIPVSLGWFFVGLAKTLSTFIIGCIIISVGLGMMLTAPRAYITEITLPNMRGVIGAMPFFFLSVGFVTVATLMVFIEWQTISYICGVYSIILMIFNCYLPETPHFALLSSPEKAIENLKRFRSKSFDVENEMEILLDYRDENDIRSLSFGETILKMFKPAVCKPFAISLAYIVLMLCSGCIVVLMWTGEMLELSNTAIASNTGNLIICLIRIVVGVMTLAILYKAKRRVIAIISAAGVGCSAIGISIYLHTHVGRHITPFYFYMAYISFAVLGYYTLPLIMMYEILPLQLRGVLGGINIALMNLIIFGMNTGFPHIRDAIGLANLMAIFGGISLSGSIILFYILPETSEVTLQEIEEYFGNKRPTLVPSRIIRSDQFISMMRASSSQVQHEGMTTSGTSSINLKTKKTVERKQKKSLNIVDEESNKKNEWNKDGGGSQDKVFNTDKDMGGLQNKISDKDKYIGGFNDSNLNYMNKQGSSKTNFQDENQSSLDDKSSDRQKVLGGLEDKLLEDKEKSDLKYEISEKHKESSINSESASDTDRGSLKNKTFNWDKLQESSNDIVSYRHEYQDGSKDKISDRDKDQSSSKVKIPDMNKDDGAKEKESVGASSHKVTDQNADQSGSTEKTVDRDKNQGGSKDETLDRKKDEDDAKDKGSVNSGREGSINKRTDIDKDNILKQYEESDPKQIKREDER